MVLTLRGTPFLYYGEEIGMTDVAVPPDRVRDIAGRDGARTPMQWDATQNAGFSTGEPWLPLAPSYRERNVAAQRDDPTSLFSLYRRLIRLRKGSVPLRRGSYRTLAAPRGVYAYTREADGERVFVALNFTDANRQVSFGAGDGRVRFSTDHRRDGDPVELTGLTLSPNEGVIVAG
jgi:alpha-glucosidase